MKKRNRVFVFLLTMVLTCAFMLPGLGTTPAVYAAAADFRITTTDATSVTEDSAALHGDLDAADYSGPIKYGFEYGKSTKVAYEKRVESTNRNETSGVFSVGIDRLDSGQRYKFRAFATIDGQTKVGTVRYFTTDEVGPEVTTNSATSITTNSARLNAEIESAGDSNIKEYGFYYGTTSSTKTKKKVGTRIDEGDDFSLRLTGLKDDTKYYFKAYARNDEGTAYGTVRSFTTKEAELPRVTTKTTTAGDGYALLYGVVTDKGTTSIDSYGFYYGTSSNPSTRIEVGNNIAEDKTFSYRLTGLTANKTYYVKAYATNDEGTGYGKVSNFKLTSSGLPSVFIIGSSWYNIQGSNQQGDAAPYIKNSRTFLPIRPVGKAVGLDDSDIVWNPTQQTVTLNGSSTTIRLTIGSRTMYVNGSPVYLDTAPEISSGRACLPIAHVVKAFGHTALWDANVRSVTIR